MRPQEKKTQPMGNRPKTARPKCYISEILAQVGKSAIASEAHGGEKRAAKAKKKADKEKAGWGIAFSEFIARAGVGLDGAEEMDAAAMQL